MAAGPAAALPLLANDPHLQLQTPGRWYLAQLDAPGLHVIGATLPALPFVVLGHNQRYRLGLHQHGLGHAGSVRRALDPADPAAT